MAVVLAVLIGMAVLTLIAGFATGTLLLIDASILCCALAALALVAYYRRRGLGHRRS